MLDIFPASQIEYLVQRVVVGKAGLVLYDLPELAVEVPNDVRCVMIFRTSVGYAEKMLKMSQFSSQLLTQEAYCFPHFYLNIIRFSRASSSVVAVKTFFKSAIRGLML